MTHVEELFPKLEVSESFMVFIQWEIYFSFIPCFSSSWGFVPDSGF